MQRLNKQPAPFHEKVANARRQNTAPECIRLPPLIVNSCLAFAAASALLSVPHNANKLSTSLLASDFEVLTFIVSTRADCQAAAGEGPPNVSRLINKTPPPSPLVRVPGDLFRARDHQLTRKGFIFFLGRETSRSLLCTILFSAPVDGDLCLDVNKRRIHGEGRPNDRADFAHLMAKLSCGARVINYNTSHASQRRDAFKIPPSPATLLCLSVSLYTFD